MTRIIDMEVSVPRFDVGDDQAHTEPGRGAPAVDTERPAGYGMANYARIFRGRREGADHRPSAALDDFVEMLGVLGVERALPFGVDNDEMAQLLRRYPGRILGLARISAFKGMSGVRELERRVRDEGIEPRWLVAGRKGASTLRFRRYEIEQAWAGFSDSPRYADAQAIAHRVSELFTEGEVDRVVLVYNTYVSALTQRVTEQDILPISADILETDEEERRYDAMRGDFIFEPEPEEILARLLPVYLETQVFRALLESAASEQGARMTAMRNASKSAGELIDTLTLAMNRARQAEITQEILEVVAGADALTQ